MKLVVGTRDHQKLSNGLFKMFLKGTNWTKQLSMSLHCLRFFFLLWWGGKKRKKKENDKQKPTQKDFCS